MRINGLYISKSRYLCDLFHSSVPHFERNAFNLLLLLGDFNSTYFVVDSLLKIESLIFLILGFGSHADLLSEHGFAQVECKDETGCCDL